MCYFAIWDIVLWSFLRRICFMKFWVACCGLVVCEHAAGWVYLSIAVGWVCVSMLWVGCVWACCGSECAVGGMRLSGVVCLPQSASSHFSVTSMDVCFFCDKRVYLLERQSAEGLFFHQPCFRCCLHHITLVLHYITWMCYFNVALCQMGMECAFKIIMGPHWSIPYIVIEWKIPQRFVESDKIFLSSTVPSVAQSVHYMHTHIVSLGSAQSLFLRPIPYLCIATIVLSRRIGDCTIIARWR